LKYNVARADLSQSNFLSHFSISFFLELQSETMFSLSRVVPELGFAFVAYVSLNGKLTELPFLIGLVNLVLAVRTFSHSNQELITPFFNLRFFVL